MKDNHYPSFDCWCCRSTEVTSPETIPLHSVFTHWIALTVISWNDSFSTSTPRLRPRKGKNNFQNQGDLVVGLSFSGRFANDDTCVPLITPISPLSPQKQDRLVLPLPSLSHYLNFCTSFTYLT